MSGHSKPTGGIVTSDSVHPHRHTLLIIGITIVGMVVIGGAAYYGVRYSPFAKHAPTKSPIASEEQLSPSQELTAAQKELQAAATPTEKTAAYTSLGRAYYDNNQPQQAITAYQSALQQSTAAGSSGTSNGTATDTQGTILAGLSVAYYRAGNVAQDIATLHQLVNLYQASGNSEEKALIPRYQQLIQQLQGISQ